MEYNIQTLKNFNSRKKLIYDYLENFLESSSTESSIHLSSEELKWVRENFPEIKFFPKKNAEKVHGRRCYVITKNTSTT